MSGTWFLQREEGGERGWNEFWDTYLHAGCQMIRESSVKPAFMKETIAGPITEVEVGAHKRLVIIESPYAGDIEANVEYARRCVRDSLMRGEAPIASHLHYTQPGILIDEIPADRERGIAAGLAWRRVADASVVYIDHGISKGMQYGIELASASGLKLEYRKLNDYKVEVP
jgi:hypothetical protein